MSKLEELIQELCPGGVEDKPIWEVTTWDKKFNSVERFKQPEVISYPYLLANDLFSLQQDEGNVFLLSTGEQTGWTTEDLAGNNICEGEVVTIPWGKSRHVVDVMKYYKGKFVTADNRIATSNNTEILMNKFLFYWMQSQGEVIDSFYRGSGLKHPSMKDVLDMRIPIPPLEVQREIVKMLDNFTELTAELIAELTAELTARKQQYEYYRDLLLTFDERGGACKVKWFALGDISEIVRGASPRPIKNYLTEGRDGVNWIKIGDATPNSKYITLVKEKITREGAAQSRYVKSGDFILSNSMSFGRPYILKTDGCIHDGWLSISKFNQYVLADYLYYILVSTSIQNEMRKKASFGGAVQNLNADIVRNIRVPVPPIETQVQLVSILDNFETLNNDLTSGLPAEIEARQKQYEYYRDKLLIFKAKSV